MAALSHNEDAVQPVAKVEVPTPRWKTFLHAPIRDDFLLEVQLLLLSFSIGIQDAASFPDCEHQV